MSENSPTGVPRHLAADPEALRRFFASPVSPTRWIEAHLHDSERIPDGGCLLVGNHGPLGIDTPVLVHALHARHGRLVRPLADRLLFRNAVGRLLAGVTQSVEGTPDNARALLRAGQWVVVYPGGARETQRTTESRYTLSWEGRTGFIKVAMEAAVPVVPVACIGNDDVFRQLRSQQEVARTLPGRAITRWLGDSYVPPLLMPIPRKGLFHYYFGEPIHLGDGDVDDEAVVADLQRRVQHALVSLLESGRAERRARRDRDGET